MRTIHQAMDLGLALLLGSAAIHRGGRTAAVLMLLGFALVLIAFTSPGLLSLRVVLAGRGHQRAELVVAVGCVVALVGVTRADLVATAPLLLTCVVLLRLGRLPVIEPRPPHGWSHDAGRYQPLLNRVARAAGAFVRSQRSSGSRDLP